VQGRILLIQEDRLRLKTDDGPVVLLTLGKWSGVSSLELASMKQSQSHVEVEYEGQTNMESGKAVGIRRLNGDR
jgi:hypothetical protein